MKRYNPWLTLLSREETNMQRKFAIFRNAIFNNMNSSNLIDQGMHEEWDRMMATLIPNLFGVLVLVICKYTLLFQI